MKNFYRFGALLAISLLFACGNSNKNEQYAQEEALLWRATEEVRDDLAKLGFEIDLSDIKLEVRDETELNRLYDNIQELSQSEVTAAGKVSFHGVEHEKERATDNGRQAFYDANSKSIVFKRGATKTLSKGYLAHELVHAFQDQKWGLGKIWDFYREQPTHDNYDIVQFLVEGYAELGRHVYEQSAVQEAFKKKAMELDLGRLVYAECLACAFTDPASMPYFFGTDFLSHAYLEGGWPLVEHYLLDPPITSEQIIHPEKKHKTVKAQVNLAEWSDENFPGKQVFSGTMGEAFLLSQLLNLKVANAEAFSSASGWEGDSAHLYLLDDGSDAMVWSVMFETKMDALQMIQTLSKIKGQQAYYLNQNKVTWIIADDLLVKESIARFLNLEKKITSLSTNTSEPTDEQITQSREIKRCTGFYPLARPFPLTKRSEGKKSSS